MSTKKNAVDPAGTSCFFRRWRLRREARRLRHEARYVRRMREDLVSAELIARIEDECRAVLDNARRGDVPAFEKARDRLLAAMGEASPPKPGAGFRENLETAIVAISVAMAIRCFFLQPFKIPTGSMQPTLYGVTVQPQEEPAWYDRFPLNLPGWMLFGEGYVDVRAKRTGVVSRKVRRTEEGYVFFIDGEPHSIRRDMPRFFEPGDRVVRGDRLAAGRVRMGDQVFVNKVRYNFSRPKRGDIPVFTTRGIHHPGVRPNAFYIKRLCGLPGESVGIDPPHIVVNGKRVLQPPVFGRMVTSPRYSGHVTAPRPRNSNYPLPLLGAPEDRITLSQHEFLMFGDNTRSSLDGRYFGAVQRESLIGPACLVYWPFSARWGLIRSRR